MFYRIYQLFLDSFKFLYRDKTNFYISSFTISICLIFIFLITIISIHTIKKIESIETPVLIVTYNKKLEDNCTNLCDYSIICPECPVYKAQNLQILESDSNIDINGKNECRKCLERDLMEPLESEERRKFLNFECEDACTPSNNSDYSQYYGSKESTACGGCLDYHCDDINNRIMGIEGIEQMTRTVYKMDVLRIWNEYYESNWFGGKFREYIALPMHGEFRVSDNIDEKSLMEMISKIKKVGEKFTDFNQNGIWDSNEKFVDSNENGIWDSFVENIKERDMIDIKNFIFYRELTNTIIGAVLIIIFITFLIPVFIVSNTIHLIIYSKRDVLGTLKILGERDFYIKLPFILHGVWQGLIGGLLAILFIYFLDILELESVLNKFLDMIIQSPESSEVTLINSFKKISLILFSGIALGVFGSLKSIRKYLK